MKMDICMIAKNESANLRLTLPSMVRGADRVIIADTGSSDNTKDLASSLGAEVFDFKWCNDFAAARNFAISKSTADWILWLDADELMEDEDIRSLKTFLEQTEENLIYLKINECEYGTKNIKNYYFRDKSFRNNIGIRFERPVNEQLVFTDPGNTRKEAVLKDINIYHWGAHLPEELMEAKKTSRIAHLKDAISKEGKDPYFYYLLGDLHIKSKDPDNGIKYMQEAADLITGEEDKHLLSLKQSAYIKMAWAYHGSKEWALGIDAAEKALKISRTNVEPFCIIGDALNKTGDPEKALEYLEEAASLPKMIHPIMGIQDYYWDVLRYMLMGGCLMKLKKYGPSADAFRKALESIDNKKPVENLIKMLEQLQLPA